MDGNDPVSGDLVLLCHSVPEASRVLLADKIKELHPNWPIMMLYNGYDPTQAKVDGALHNLETPAKVLEMVEFLTAGLKRPSKSAFSFTVLIVASFGG